MNWTCVERLEFRKLLSAAPSLSSRGTLYVPGTPEDDRIIVSFAGANVRVTVGADAWLFPRSNVKRLSVEAGGGRDVVMNKTTLPSTLAGGSGNDTFFGGRGADVLSGNKGNDRLYSSGGHDTLTGGAGRDAVDYSTATAGVQIRTAVTVAGPDFPFPSSVPFYVGAGSGIPSEGELPATGKRDVVDAFSFEIIVLSAFNDGMQFEPTKTSFNPNSVTTLYGGAGNDGFESDGQAPFVCFGEAGDDFFSADQFSGSFRAFGGEGDDTLAANPATNEFDMGPGDNWLAYDLSFGDVQLGAGNVHNVYDVQGASGATVTIFGDDGPNVISTEVPGIIDPVPPTFPLRLIGNGGDDTIEGGAGDDSLLGGQGQDVLRGGEGNDFVDGGPAGDRLYGDAGNDTIFAHRGRDRVYGGDGDDVIFARDGRRDTIYGGPGEDSATIDDGPAVFDLVSEIEQFT